MSRYVDRYTKCYLSYKSIVPNYKDLHSLFKERARLYRCWYVSIVLNIVGVLGILGNPVRLLTMLNDLKWKVKRDLLKNRLSKENLRLVL
jgi:hypothetical protein